MTAYGDDLAAIHSAGFTDFARAAARELLRRLPKAARIVELGSGDGTTAALLTEAGHEVHGIEQSAAAVALARAHAPRASFEVGSFVDAAFPAKCDAVIAIGEVLGYAIDERVSEETLDAVVERCARSLEPGGLLLFDLAGPNRAVGDHWREGPGWAIFSQSTRDGRLLTRRIVSFRDAGGSCFRRSEEIHRLVLHRPSAVLERLRRAGFSARTLASGYDGTPLPHGCTVYVATRRAR